MAEIKNKKFRILKKWSVFIAWTLSFCGVSVGNFGCSAYGPPDDMPMRELNNLKDEISDMEKRVNTLSNEEIELSKSIDKKNDEIKKLQLEKEYLKKLFEENEK